MTQKHARSDNEVRTIGGRRRLKGETRERYEARLAQYQDETAARRALLALDAGGMSSWQWDVQTGLVGGDQHWADMFEIEGGAPVPSDRIFGMIHEEDRPDVDAELDAAFSPGGEEEFELEFRIVHTDDSHQWVAGRGRVVDRDANGRPLSVLGVNWDLTEQKEHEENLAVLASEMDHRVKNAFAVIRALITIGRRTADDVGGFAETLAAQVQAMADAHAVSAALAREKAQPRVAVPVADVLRPALAPWLEGGNDARADVRVTIEADDAAIIVPRQVSPVAMLAYELATNAAKHGALGERGGHLHLSAQVETKGERPEVMLRWHEEVASGQDDLSAQAAKEAEQGIGSGFGSVLVQHCASTLDARIKREMRPTGLHFEIRIPMAGG